MSEDLPVEWYQANQRYLVRAIAGVWAELTQFLQRPSQNAAPAAESEGDGEPMRRPPALDTLCLTFRLSSFERKILLLCAGLEMESRFAELYRSIDSPQPTFSLALAAFPDAHWSALSPDRPLRHWQLIELPSVGPLTTRPLTINERILHYLAGVPASDMRIAGIITPAPVPENLVPSHLKVAEAIADLWSHADPEVRLPAVELRGDETAAKRTIAAHASAMLGLRLHMLPAWRLPQATTELEGLMRLWEREAALSASALLLECGDADDVQAPMRRAATSLIEAIRCPLLISTNGQWRPVERALARFDVAKPTAPEQSTVWRAALESVFPDFNGHAENLTDQFSLNPAVIHSLAERAAGQAENLTQALWDACRTHSQPFLEGLAQRIDAAAAWDDLVLPVKQKHILRQIAVHVRRRGRVYREWGFESKGSRGLGISALFAGPSGTGKTMAAEVLANDLRLDLYRIDLSQVVSKYIGETEKNLRRVFDAADHGAGILLFDEADALFGKRTEVKDSHDRYANIEVSYLLQRMEAYRGLAILTTNRKNALDQAFLRRIRFVVEFPFPEAAERAEIWRRVFPAATPTDQLRIERLARLNAAGGNIRNIAIGAAFLAADVGEPVRMSHLLAAAQQEFAKIEKPLSDAEVAGWL